MYANNTQSNLGIFQFLLICFEMILLPYNKVGKSLIATKIY